MICSGLILCGGKSERLGGIDKPLRVLAGRPLIEHVLCRVAPQVQSILLSANRSREAYAAYGHDVVDDAAHAGYGPLAGVLAGLDAASAELLLCVPGDAPLLPLELAQRLGHARSAADAEIAFADDGAGPQPLCCLLPRTLRADLRSYLDSGGRAPREWFARHRAVCADFSDAPRWAWSLNTEDQWRAAERRLAESLPT